MKRRTAMLLFLAAAWTLPGSLAQSDRRTEPEWHPPSADEVALQLHQHNLERNAALLRYQSHRVMTLEYKGLIGAKRATEDVEMTFNAPGTKQFMVLGGTGSPLLRDNVFAREMENEREAAEPQERAAAAITPANYALRLVGTERLPEGECYVLDVKPKTTSRFAFTGRVWVQNMEFAVVKIQASPRDDPSFWLRDESFTATFEKVNDFWLPKETISTSHVRLGGQATFTIQFGPYRIL